LPKDGSVRQERAGLWLDPVSGGALPLQQDHDLARRGRRRVPKALTAFIDRWHGKHPLPWDTFNTFNEFLGYRPQFFSLARFTAFDLSWSGHYGYHLWFLIFRFCYSVVSLPLLLYLRGGKARWRQALMTRVCRRPGGVLLLALPVALSQIILRPLFGGYQSRADTCFGGFFYVYGTGFRQRNQPGPRTAPVLVSSVPDRFRRRSCSRQARARCPGSARASRAAPDAARAHPGWARL
jgi:hypothetical protein